MHESLQRNRNRNTAAHIVNCGIAFGLLLVGCNTRGIVLELHSPVKPTQIRFVVDKTNGETPQRIASGTYAIQLSKAGVATLDSLKVLEQWHKKVLVVNGRRISSFYLTNGNLEQASEVKIVQGGSRRTSQEDGTVITYDVKYVKQ